MKVGQIIKIELEVNIAVSRCLYGNGSKVEACQIDRLYANKQTRLRGPGTMARPVRTANCCLGPTLANVQSNTTVTLLFQDISVRIMGFIERAHRQ